MNKYTIAIYSGTKVFAININTAYLSTFSFTPKKCVEMVLSTLGHKNFGVLSSFEIVNTSFP